MYEHLRAVDPPRGDQETVRARAAVLRRRRLVVAALAGAAGLTSVVAIVAVGVGAPDSRSDTLTPVQPPSATVSSTPPSAFVLGPTDTSANGFGWGVPAVPAPTDDRSDGVPGWVAPPVGRCQSSTFTAREGGAPSDQLQLSVGRPPWSSVEERGLQVPFTITNTGPVPVTLAFRSRAQVLDVPSAELNAVGDTFPFTIEPGESLERSAQIVLGDCADTSATFTTPLPPGTYRVGVELVVDGYSPWYGTSESVTVS